MLSDTITTTKLIAATTTATYPTPCNNEKLKSAIAICKDNLSLTKLCCMTKATKHY